MNDISVIGLDIAKHVFHVVGLSTLQMARDDYETRRERQRQGIEKGKREGKYNGRKADKVTHRRIIELRTNGTSISKTANLCECSQSLVKLVWKKHNESKAMHTGIG